MKDGEIWKFRQFWKQLQRRKTNFTHTWRNPIMKRTRSNPYKSKTRLASGVMIVINDATPIPPARMNFAPNLSARYPPINKWYLLQKYFHLWPNQSNQNRKTHWWIVYPLLVMMVLRYNAKFWFAFVLDLKKTNQWIIKI